jgi:hypothetical protein
MQLVGETLPVGLSLRDLGVHRLRDVQRPERVFQFVAPDLLDHFPPTSGAEDSHNLPTPATPLVGRAFELARVTALLLEPDVRVVTLFGPGGVGKTRLELQVASDAARWLTDGWSWSRSAT